MILGDISDDAVEPTVGCDNLQDFRREHLNRVEGCIHQNTLIKHTRNLMIPRNLLLKTITSF